ncbi:Uncharacterized protein OS=Sorangium cellulosum (strain So ce56) GN=sce5710 PE=4 SV=1 [Gemmataceae bacterium]|nr:Uncharacterized protein OS=Sorangium cellulosum (strain So ce56) GN=sce5710 PE=4 SV=1 [Gemmataceae bacterium]VTT98736.1 Uncharacterized protein OS=Sorangium cellulosum (strain So ce56) GN=sce5710 PE=4 SV=1 [Gemmataceae bacterium]
MTEQEWITCADPAQIIDFLRENGNGRKLRLFACGCVRQIWHLVEVGSSRHAVEVAEKFADNEASDADLKKAYLRAAAEVKDVPEYDVTHADPACAVSREHSWDAAYCVEHIVTSRLRPDWKESRQIHSSMLRDIFGNPFRPVVFTPEWRTCTAVALAQLMYESRDFSPMPILADALQDAGCANDDILNHCRGPGPHVRGCWVVDLVLGKV